MSAAPVASPTIPGFVTVRLVADATAEITLPGGVVVRVPVPTDLAHARAAWLAERQGRDLVEREKSDQLAYQDRTGGTADFHALRHTFITNLV